MEHTKENGHFQSDDANGSNQQSVRPKNWQRFNRKKSQKGKVPPVKGSGRVDKSSRRKFGKNSVKTFEAKDENRQFNVTSLLGDYHSQQRSLKRSQFGNTVQFPVLSKPLLEGIEVAPVNRAKFSNTIQLPAIDGSKFRRVENAHSRRSFGASNESLAEHDAVMHDLWNYDYGKCRSPDAPLEETRRMSETEPYLGILHAKMEPFKRPECAFCKRNNSKDYFHPLKDELGGVVCPVLSAFTCKMCAATGRNAHTHKYCPVNPITKGDPIAAGMPPGRPLTKADKEWLKYFHAKFLLQVLDGSKVLLQ